MSTSFERFFNILELLDMLRNRLGLQDVSRLACTNRKLHQLCTPLLFKNLLDVVLSQENQPYRVSRILSTTPGMEAFARNVQHISTLAFGVDELACYYNSLVAFEDSTGTPTTSPPGLPPPDVDASQLIAMPRMTNLSRLAMWLSKSHYRLYTLPSVKSAQATFAQLYFVLSLHPGLKTLQLFGAPIMDLQEGWRLGRIISGMPRLEWLSIEVHCGSDDWSGLCSGILFSCPPTLVYLSLNFFEGRSRDPVQPWNCFEHENNEDEVAEARRRVPLVNLKGLRLRGMYGYYWDSGIDQSIFAHCPNIKQLDLTSFMGDHDIATIGEYIGKVCPKIESLHCRDFDYGEGRQESLAFRIMSGLPAQQITRLEYTGLPFDFNSSAAILAVQQHSTSLREIRINGVDGYYRISGSTILKECLNLEVLYFPYDHFEGHYITLNDGLEQPWACTKLRQLTLGISGCELPIELGVQPYYRRPTPITLTQTERQHLAQLKRLYQQLGGLTALQELDLTMVSLEESEQIDDDMLGMAMSFPAMLNLEDASTACPSPQVKLR
ncbi:hypothetical protein BGW39_005345 [Mortierella sp. 14UC]|nr:hypothetical protein BGW39_005345 [Mortierella sp. 14UC]